MQASALDMDACSPRRVPTPHIRHTRDSHFQGLSIQIEERMVEKKASTLIPRKE